MAFPLCLVDVARRIMLFMQFVYVYGKLSHLICCALCSDRCNTLYIVDGCKKELRVALRCLEVVRNVVLWASSSATASHSIE